MEAQLPRPLCDLTDDPPDALLPDAAQPDALTDPSRLAELRAVAGALLTRLAELRERDMSVPDGLWQAAERLQPLLDGVDPSLAEEEELWELALALPGMSAQADAAGSPPAALLFVRDGVEHVEP